MASHWDPDDLSPSVTASRSNPNRSSHELYFVGFRGPVLTPINCLLLGLLEGMAGRIEVVLA